MESLSRLPRPPESCPLLKSCKQCAWLAAAALVLLRLAIGIHFFQEGTGKLAERKPFSAGFFGNAKGPLADFYKGMVWDPDGRIRLGLPATNDPSFAGHAFKPDPGPVLAHWEAFSKRAVTHFELDEKQKSKVEQITKTLADAYKGHLRANSEDIETYYQQLIRRDAYAQKPERNLESFKTHDARNQGDWMKLRGPLLATIDQSGRDLERLVNEVATPAQREAHDWLPLGRVGEPPMSADKMDKIIPYFDTAIGVCLILGLFTRTAAVLGALFLASVCAAQFPGYPGAAPIYYQAVEMLALFALAANGAGKWFSVDALLGCCRGWCCPPKAGVEK
jgi:uncharacterized membrane protein YphA (DoxX/SURF4 family)